MVNRDDIVPLRYHSKAHNLEIGLCSVDTVERLNWVTAEPAFQEAWQMILTQRRKVDLIRTGRCRLIVKIAFLTKIDPVLDARSLHVSNQPPPTQQQQKYHQ
jgi:hypothetical protein